MGLDVSHDCWRGAYSAFMRWRAGLAHTVGIPLRLMQGFYEPPSEDVVNRTKPRAAAFHQSASGGMVADRDSLSSALADMAERGDGGRWYSWASQFLSELPIKWEVLKPDPIHLLLNHSDCDGSIAATDCRALADRLEEILPLLPEGEDWGHMGNWRATTQRFITGLRKAAAAGEDVVFS